MIILGLGGIPKDPACAVLKDGELVAAVEEKKVARNLKSSGLPQEATAIALNLAGVAPSQVNCVALVRPFSHDTHLALRSQFAKAQIVMVEHHTAHAASAYYPSGFDEAAVLTLDRDGDFRSTGRWRASGNQLQLERDLYYPDSLGDLYGRVTELLGFNSGSDEHKIQWLSTAADGAAYSPLFDEILGGSEWPAIDRSYFDADRLSQGGFSEKFYRHVGLSDGESIPDKLKAPLAAGLQRAIEQAVLRMAGPSSKLCVAGGLALNALLISSLEASKEVYVQPAAGNTGTALGAVFYAWNSVCGQRRRASLNDLCLGPSFSSEEIKKVIENCKLRFRYLLTTGELIDDAVRRLNDEKIIAWMQGRMEFGPRALGNRSILASPLNPYSTENLNIYIKHREPFRKFAASVPAEAADEYFETGPNGRYLATVGRVRPEHHKTFEAAIMGKDSIRVHTVHKDANPLYHRLLHAAGKATGLPVLYNTSFNLFGDPLVCTPRDAVRSFYSSGIDALFVGNFVLEK
ncbi:MAG TPA: carbamoyltransferase C-terminal domain-containing protein [Bryobacteraceae bacterium]|nr:carbamoyltransferase C-terminal domain-containing protein [Bryobacteraceae bacterium]